jgi:predicted nucleic acid-binding protein
MTESSLVLIDTCIWGPFFSKPQSEAKCAIDSLIKLDRAAVIGPVFAEALQGFQRESEANWAYSRILSVRYLEVTLQDWRNAAALGRMLAARKHQLPLTDLVLAAVVRRLNCSLHSSDPHFDLIPGIFRDVPFK